MRIDNRVLTSIKMKAKEYMIKVKGKDVTDEDFIIAENLIIFGYLKAYGVIKQEESKVAKSNEAYNLLTESY